MCEGDLIERSVLLSVGGAGKSRSPGLPRTSLIQWRTETLARLRTNLEEMASGRTAKMTALLRPATNRVALVTELG